MNHAVEDEHDDDGEEEDDNIEDLYTDDEESYGESDDEESDCSEEGPPQVQVTAPPGFRRVKSPDSNPKFALELPPVIRKELDRRKRGEAKGPPNPLVVHALRQYFESGKGDPMVAGGFMTLMREIGAVAQSKDHLVKHSEHNIWYMGAKGEEDSNEWWQDQLERHEAEVRLLRYGEFMEMQEIKGLSYEAHWRFQELDDKENLVGDDRLAIVQQQQRQQQEDSKLPPSSTLTQEQLSGLSKHFINGFWQYVNHEQIAQEQDQSETMDESTTSINHSQSSHSMNFSQSHSSQLSLQTSSKANGHQPTQTTTTTTLEPQSAEQVLRKHCHDLELRYRELRRPLGYSLVAHSDPEPSPAAKKMSGKKQRKRHRQQQRNNKTSNTHGGKKKDHADCIRDHLQALLKLCDKQLLVRPGPSPLCARVVVAMVNMLRAGVGADPDVARTLAYAATTLLTLRSRAATFAQEADDKDNTNTSLGDGDAWWELFTVLTMLLADIVVTLTGDKENRNEYRSTAATPLTADEKLASRFFEVDVSPVLLQSIQAPLATERCASLKALGRMVCATSVELAMGLVKPKSTWTLLEQACMVPDVPPQSETPLTRTQQRDNIMAPRSAAQATSLLIRLCGTGMIKEESDGPPGMTIIPGPLARKMIQRGIVPFLMQLSRSQHDLVSVDAVGGLAQISCVKDCRTSLLQQPDGVEWLQWVLSSPEGHKVSQAVLLLRHLLWDDEWLEPILSVDPPIEQTIVRWMAFCMKAIRERADETRIASKKLADEFMARSLSRISLAENLNRVSAAEQQAINAEIKAMEARLQNQIAWNKLETDEGRTHITNLTLSRGVIFLSTLIRDKVTSERVLKANCLALGAACLDVPVDDTNSAAANIIGNYLSTAGAVPPNVFPDPDHVVRAAISRLSRLVNRQDITPRSFIFVRLLNGLRKNSDWAPFFQSCAEQDMEHKYVIEVFLPKIGDNIPASSPPKNNNNSTSNAGSNSSTNNPRQRPEAEKANGGRPRPRKKAVRPQSSSDHASATTAATNAAAATTKLNSCDHCGMTESKPGEFKKCSQCNVTYYCGRQCQTDAWKKHKKECPTLAATAKKKAGKKSKKKAGKPTTNTAQPKKEGG